MFRISWFTPTYCKQNRMFHKKFIQRSKAKMRALVKRNPDVGYEFDENTEILLRFQII